MYLYVIRVQYKYNNSLMGVPNTIYFFIFVFVVYVFCCRYVCNRYCGRNIGILFHNVLPSKPLDTIFFARFAFYGTCVVARSFAYFTIYFNIELGIILLCSMHRYLISPWFNGVACRNRPRTRIRVSITFVINNKMHNITCMHIIGCCTLQFSGFLIFD